MDKPGVALPPCPSPQPLRAPVFILPASCLLHTALWGCAAWTERFFSPFGYPPVFSIPLLFTSPAGPSVAASVRVFLIARNFFCTVWAGDRFFFPPSVPRTVSFFLFNNFVFFPSPASLFVDFTLFPPQFHHLFHPTFPLSLSFPLSVPLPHPFALLKQFNDASGLLAHPPSAERGTLH